MKELYSKFPELIKALITQLSKSNLKSKPYINKAHNKLLLKLKSVSEEMENLTNKNLEGEINQEQVEQMLKGIFDTIKKAGGT